MKRMNLTDVNTPDAYNAIYASYRRNELQAWLPLQMILLAAIRAEDTVLDVGCGVGQYYPYLKQASAVEGIDFAPEPAEEAARCGYTNVLTADFAQHLPFPDGMFTVVYCAEILEHMEDPQRLIDECFRVLTATGLLILTTPYKDSIPCPEHLWAFEEDDLRTFCAAFTSTALFRYGIELEDHWEHFLVLARK